MNNKFWKNRPVLVTGFAGFLGTNLVRRLLRRGAVVIGLDINVDRKDTLLTTEDRKGIIEVKGDVSHYSAVKRLITRYSPATVFHLAAEALVSDSLKAPQRAFTSNIKGTWSVLEACRGVNEIESVVVASSDKAYGIHEKLPYEETAPLRGTHPYDVSKSCADLIARTYAVTYGLPVSITRCGNIYGPGDFNFSRIVPDTIRGIVLDKQLDIRSDGSFTRDYVYVEDIVDGYVLMAEKTGRAGLAGQAFNFSYENPLSVLELVGKIYSLAGKEARYRILNRARHEIPHQYLSSGKARKVLGWKPSCSLDSSLKKTILWYKRYLKK